MDTEFPTPPVTPDGPAQRARWGGLSRRAATAATALGLLAGGAVGGVVISHAATAGSTPSASSGSGTTTTPAQNAPRSGRFVPNEDAAHEAGESAAREAQEDAGQFPTVP